MVARVTVTTFSLTQCNQMVLYLVTCNQNEVSAVRRAIHEKKREKKKKKSHSLNQSWSEFRVKQFQVQAIPKI